MSTESISKMGLCRSNYADDKSFINAIQEEVTRAVPPTKMTFSSKEQLDSFAKTALGLAGDRVITNHLFSCKLANLGLSLNLKEEEIKGLDADEYPITLTAKTFDDVLDFSVAYQAATPVKRVTSKGSKVPNVSALLSFTKKEKIIIAIAFLAVIVILPFYNFVSTKIEEKQARELQEQYNSERRNMYTPNKDVLKEYNAQQEAKEAKKAEREMLQNRYDELRREYEALSRQIQNTPVGKDELLRKRDRVDAEAKRIRQELAR